MFQAFRSLYSPRYPKTLIYMLQSSEYKTKPYLGWVHRTKDFSSVIKRRTLDKTRAARALIYAIYGGIALQLIAGIILIVLGITNHLLGGIYFGIAVIVIYPIVWAYLIVVPLELGRVLVDKPQEKQAIAVAATQFQKHKAKKIAVAGSYGKTTMKELLNTVLAEGLIVAATPANKNVSRSHAQFAKQLTGTEDVLIIEYGEGAPGDVASFAAITKPTHAVITGIAPAHLDQYKTLEAAAQDIFSVADYLKGKNVYVNNDADAVTPYLKKAYHTFDRHGALGWTTSNIITDIDGTSFELHKAQQVIKLKSRLIGKHQVGFLAFVAAIGLEFGLTNEQVVAGIGKTKPFEHRMQPYKLGGAWVIDDTYNGNLEGIRAGTQLLSDLDATRKIYITPGLVDQGEETEPVHIEVGKLIAAANPDVVVLMQNSVTTYMQQGLRAANYNGTIQIERDPLEFYTNLSHFVAHDDLVVMQNDWTDNYK